MNFNVTVGEKNYRLKLERNAEAWRCELDGRAIAIDVHPVKPQIISLLVSGKGYKIARDSARNHPRIWVNGVPYFAEVSDPRALKPRSLNSANASSQLLASMPGKVLRVLVRDSERVEAEQSLMVVEAMKMQNEIKSPKAGIVKQLVAEGCRVNAGDVLALVE